jgi:hypothetical protein
VDSRRGMPATSCGGLVFRRLWWPRESGPPSARSESYEAFVCVHDPCHELDARARGGNCNGRIDATLIQACDGRVARRTGVDTVMATTACLRADHLPRSRRCHGDDSVPGLRADHLPRFRPPHRSHRRAPTCGDSANAPERTRTSTDHTVHKALNLARLPIPPQALGAASIASSGWHPEHRAGRFAGWESPPWRAFGWRQTTPRERGGARRRLSPSVGGATFPNTCST